MNCAGQSGVLLDLPSSLGLPRRGLLHKIFNKSSTLMNTIHNHLVPPRAVLGTLLFATVFSACGGGRGESGPPASPGPQGACFEQPGQELGGRWHVTGAVLELDTAVSDTYVPNGLDDLDIDVDFLLGEEDQGVCALLYSASSSSLDTTSPSGGPSTMLAVAASTLPAGVFGLVGMLYYPAGDVTTSVDVEFGSFQPLGPTSFQSVVEFEVFDGEQIELVVDNVRGEDDDGDGEIDEADELDPSDGIEPNANLVCAGRMRLTISRVASFAPLNLPTLTTTLGILRDTTDAAAHPALVTIDVARMLVMLETDGLLLGGQRLRLAAPIDASGRFVASAVDGGAGLNLRGWINNGALAALALVAHEAEATRTFLLEPKPGSKCPR